MIKSASSADQRAGPGGTWAEASVEEPTGVGFSVESHLDTPIRPVQPRRQRASVSAYIGFGFPLGLILGSTLLVKKILHSQIQPSYYVIAAIFLVVIVLLAVTLPDKQLPRSARPAFNLGRFLKSFWISPVKHPDFGWAWITRFCIIIPSAAVTVVPGGLLPIGTGR